MYQRKRRVLEALGDSRRNVTELAQELGLTHGETKTALRKLALDGAVRMDGGMWETIAD